MIVVGIRYVLLGFQEVSGGIVANMYMVLICAENMSLKQVKRNRIEERYRDRFRDKRTQRVTEELKEKKI